LIKPHQGHTDTFAIEGVSSPCDDWKDEVGIIKKNICIY
jgi:hypothetical protein